MIGKAVLRSWIELFRSLGQSFLDLLRAEIDQVVAELGVSAKKAGIGIALLAAAAALGFWWLGVLTYFLIQVVALWLPVWASAGVVLLVLLLLIGGLGWFGMRKLQSIENPVDTVSRRYDDHLDWWESRLLAEERRVEEPLGAESREELS